MCVLQMCQVKSESVTVLDLLRKNERASLGTSKGTTEESNIITLEEDSQECLTQEQQREDCYSSSQMNSSPYTQRKKLKKIDDKTPESKELTNLIQMEISTADPEITVDIQRKVKKLLDELVKCNEELSDENIKFVTVHRAVK